jgi:hypothetical protein
VNGSLRPLDAVVAVVVPDELVVVLPGVESEAPEAVPGDVPGLLELDCVGCGLGVDDLCVCE